MQSTRKLELPDALSDTKHIFPLNDNRVIGITFCGRSKFGVKGKWQLFSSNSFKITVGLISFRIYITELSETLPIRLRILIVPSSQFRKKKKKLSHSCCAPPFSTQMKFFFLLLGVILRGQCSMGVLQSSYMTSVSI